MFHIGISQIILYFLVVLACVKPLGSYMAYVYDGKITFLKFIENYIYRSCKINPQQEMNWKEYLINMLVFNLLGILMVYLILRLQFFFPLNPQHFLGVKPVLAFNTAISFATNTNWQSYSGENTLSYFSQMLGLTVQNFISAAVGMSLLIAFIRGLRGQTTEGLGNLWVDITRSIFYILLPLAFILALFLVSQGVIQNLKPNETVNLLQPYTLEQQIRTTQIIPMGPVASQVAIKQLGTNGGGFFKVNSAHPFENPTPVSNFFELLAILLIPAALCYTFGVMIQSKKQGWAIIITMLCLLIPPLILTTVYEQKGNPLLSPFDVEQNYHYSLSSGGNLEGKEVRFGTVSSSLWANATAASANGSVNAMLDSFIPLASLMPLSLMHLGEVVFGGVGSGLYRMLILIIVAVFIAGLMVGRTPEFLGKKIEPFEIKMASLVILIMPLSVLLSTALAIFMSEKSDATGHLDLASHELTEMLYAFTSLSNNNGSALMGLNTHHLFFNILGGIIMLIARYWVAIPVLAIAGSLARKKINPMSAGTVQTHSPTFIILLVGIILGLGALSFFPVLTLGPIMEQLALQGAATV